MAKCIYVCSKQALPSSVQNKLLGICRELAPENIIPAPPKILVNGAIAYGVMNPVKSQLESGNSLLLGHIIDKKDNWGEPLQDFPEGSFALFRDGSTHLEIVTDAVASRTIWYFLGEDIFVASTSQRAIVMFLGSFELEKKVIPWMLSSGSLGPGLSWDKRIIPIAPDSSVTLDKRNWSISIKSNPVEFTAAGGSDEEHQANITEALAATFTALKLDYGSCALPLSGGYDSRAILCLLLKYQDAQTLRTVTWGLASSIHKNSNDAFIAKQLAEKLQVPHKYYHTDLSGEPIAQVINRFVLFGEGRVDHLAGYMDGFKLWKDLFEDGIVTTIRGDEGFGFMAAFSPLHLRTQQGCGLCTDYINLRNYKKYGFTKQEMPEHLHRRKKESLTAWRDRLYQQFRMPVIQAALADLKLSYVEQVSPFFFKRVLREARQLPEHLLLDRSLFKRIVVSISPEVAFSSVDATASSRDILRQAIVVDFLKTELSSLETSGAMPARFIEFVQAGIKTGGKEKALEPTRLSMKHLAKKYLPPFIKRLIHRLPLQKVDPNILAFRVYLISKMEQVLREDSMRFK